MANPVDGLKTIRLHKISKSDPKANYFPPSRGPFKCGNCEYFHAPHDCEKVSGDVDAEGCCNLFENKD